ncbi:hypothetical protein NM208_g16827 [Fusarium decemcellulare]|uniref:Uncharacterized protein n=1 Tax=Fusarium decemcellulare TaxID=57161 RepID=A0ACC1R9L9_9HYPO|nr:hypothetical protein NM208_g16827 [Fusarium decemcellulare]
MRQLRGRSVPPKKALPPSPPSSQKPLVPLRSGTASQPLSYSTDLILGDPSLRDATYLGQADALSAMTFELSLHALIKLTHRLERDVDELLLEKTRNEAIRRTNEARIDRLKSECDAIRVRLAAVDGKHAATQADVEHLKRQMARTTEGWRTELDILREKVDLLSREKEQNSGMESVKGKEHVKKENHLAKSPAPTGVETRAMHRARMQANTLAQRQHGSSASSSLEARIDEAVNSTKRWNRERKVTKVPEARFIAGYLKKQRQRDPAIAKLLQYGIQKRCSLEVKAESEQAWSPQSLEELCYNASWQAVIDTATEVLDLVLSTGQLGLLVAQLLLEVIDNILDALLLVTLGTSIVVQILVVIIVIVVIRYLF